MVELDVLATHPTVYLLATVVVFVMAVAFAKRRRALRHAPPSADHTAIPWASGAVPILGHALAYKKCPASFVVDQCKKVGPIFRLNLAGKVMIVIGNSQQLLKQIAWQPERKCSSREAVAQVGFEQTLGAFSVREGTDLHRRTVKTWLRRDRGGLQGEVPKLYESLKRSLDIELQRLGANSGGEIQVPDVFSLVRRCVLRSSIERLVGPGVLREQDDLLSEFMVFQDAVEDATAKAAVLPRPIALVVALWPVQSKRQTLQRRLKSIIERILAEAEASGDDAGLGPWLQTIKDPANGLSSAQGAELVISLLFAAHKNPAIGTAQALLYLLTGKGQSLKQERELAKREAAALREATASEKASVLRTCVAVRRCCLETLRMTAHTLGALRIVQEPLDVKSEAGEVFRLEPGDNVALSHIACSWDKNLWGGDAHSYNPLRPEWLPTPSSPHRDGNSDSENDSAMACCSASGDAVGKLSAFKMTTFSHGIHVCPGQRLALGIMQVRVARFLLAFVLTCG